MSWGHFLLVLAVLSSVACSQLMRGLRPEFDDGYVQEREPIRGGLLADYPEYSASGPSRGIASERESQGWVNRMAPSRGMRDRGAPVVEGREQELSSETAERVAAEPAPLRRTTRDDFVDGAEDSGSLWSTNGQTNFFFSKNKTRTAGDLINVAIEGDLLRDLAAEVKRSLSPEERQNELQLLARAARPAEPKGGSKPPSDGKSDAIQQSSAAPDEEGRFSMSQVDLTGAIGVKEGDQFLVEVVERFSNGNYKIRGTKRLSYRGTTKLMTLVGVVRGADLSDDDKVNSGKLYEYRLEVVR
jgi:flagellar basal body L-ring protein FlgH